MIGDSDSDGMIGGSGVVMVSEGVSVVSAGVSGGF